MGAVTVVEEVALGCILVQPLGHSVIVSVVAAVTVNVCPPRVKVVGEGQYVVKYVVSNVSVTLGAVTVGNIHDEGFNLELSVLTTGGALEGFLVQPLGHSVMVSVVAAVTVNVCPPRVKVVGEGQYVVKYVVSNVSVTLGPVTVGIDAVQVGLVSIEVELMNREDNEEKTEENVGVSVLGGTDLDEFDSIEEGARAEENEVVFLVSTLEYTDGMTALELVGTGAAEVGEVRLVELAMVLVVVGVITLGVEDGVEEIEEIEMVGVAEEIVGAVVVVEEVVEEARDVVELTELASVLVVVGVV